MVINNIWSVTIYIVSQNIRSVTIYLQQQYTVTDHVLSMTIDGQVNTTLKYFFPSMYVIYCIYSLNELKWILCFTVFRRSCGKLRFTVFQKVMWNITFYCISEGRVEYYVLLYFRRSCWILRFTVFQKVMWNIVFYCISEGHVEY